MRLFETVAVMHVADIMQWGIFSSEPVKAELLRCAGLLQEPDGHNVAVDFDRALVTANSGTASYHSVVAACLEVPVQRGFLRPLPIQVIANSVKRRILMCPFPLAANLGVNVASAWAKVHHFLKSYQIPVAVLGQNGQWLDNCPFAECDILSELSVAEKLEYLASSALVIGVPNEWTWLAASLGVPMVVLYPAWLPPLRWFPYSSDKIGRAQLEMNLHTPSLLAGLRQLIHIL